MTHLSTSLAVTAAPESAEIDVRLAASRAEIEAAQHLRYRVFYQEMGARPCSRTLLTGRDEDRFDAVCDHLLAIADGEVVGTYRLITSEAAALVGGFYSAGEFDISPLLARGGNVLELGRSCVAAAWRNRGTLQALWQGLSAYVAEHRISMLFGCASLPGIDLSVLAPSLAYLRANHMAPAEWRATALPQYRVDPPAMLAPLDERSVFRSLPPLLKGYLRAGAWIGDGAVTDNQFNTTDVLVTLDTRALTTRYQRRYDAAS